MGYDDSVKTIYIVFQGSASIENWFASNIFIFIFYFLFCLFL